MIAVGSQACLFPGSVFLLHCLSACVLTRFVRPMRVSLFCPVCLHTHVSSSLSISQHRVFLYALYVFYAFYAWWVFFPQSAVYIACLVLKITSILTK
jgi:hypothetical protein